MDALTEQLNGIVQQLKEVSDAQKHQDGRLTYLFDKIENNQPPVQQEVPVVDRRISPVDLFRIPDPIKSIPSFEGNRKQLYSWLKTAEDTLLVFQPLVTEQQFGLYIQAVMNKIEGKAKDILCLAGNPQSFIQIKDVLIEALGDRQELSYYKSVLWATKQGEAMTIHSYFNKIKETVQNIKALSKLNKMYNDSWPAISTFIEEDALAAFISGLRKPYFGYAQAARPKCIEEAYAFLCKFNSNELISTNNKKLSHITPNIQKNNSFQPNQQKVNVFQQKNRDFDQKNFKRQSYSVHEPPTPMDVDLSMRSRNTFNKKIVNNHEVNDTEEQLLESVDTNYAQQIEDTDSENFHEVANSDTED